MTGVERTRCVDIPYLNEHGDVTAVRKRLRLAGEPRMIWRRGDKTSPYGLWRLDMARAARTVIIVEGESDSWTGWYADVPVLGLPGASTWQEAHKRYLQDVGTVYVWREPDQGGETLIARVTADLSDIRVVAPPAGLKDLNALWHAVGHDKAQFRSRLSTLLASSRLASQLRAEAFITESRELLERCRTLLEDPLLLGKVKAAITAKGYAGDATAPILAYLSLTSRLLERPLNLSFVAPSGAGKNRAVDAAVELMPEDAYFLEKAGSARALVYADASFEHKIVIVSEADSIPQDEGSAASAIRSLVEDSYMTYDYVAADPESGSFVTRRITKPGPTGLITTSIRPLKEQLSTRTFSVPINDSPDQTREVMRAHAASVNGGHPQVNVANFIDLQRWLALAGEREVAVPYARALAELVPSTHVRMRRDFRQLLTIIQSVTLLYQRQRDRDQQGQVVATLEDYRWARELVLSVLTAAASGGVTPQVRQTVEGLQRLQGETQAPVTRKALGDSLGLATDTVWHRVQRAIELGYIVNQETRERQPAKLIPGDPLPEDKPALPTPEELAEYMCAGDSENHSIVQSDAPRQTQVESEPAFENAIETGVQTDIQTLDEADLDSKATAPGEPIERLNEKTEDLHTSGESPSRDPEEPAAEDGHCSQPNCGGQLWAYAPDGSPRCQAHYHAVEHSALATAAMEVGARIQNVSVSLNGSFPDQPGNAADGDDEQETRDGFGVKPATARRCCTCGHNLSVLNESGACGRCASSAYHQNPAYEVADPKDERHLRGHALVALDKHDYPRLTLTSGQVVGPGLELWAPVLRGMDGNELRELLTLIQGKRA